jgi:hypothetical protein
MSGKVFTNEKALRKVAGAQSGFAVSPANFTILSPPSHWYPGALPQEKTYPAVPWKGRGGVL